MRIVSKVTMKDREGCTIEKGREFETIEGPTKENGRSVKIECGCGRVAVLLAREWEPAKLTVRLLVDHADGQKCKHGDRVDP
jgi:hypothetical protein